jgi:hypothetical protein
MSSRNSCSFNSNHKEKYPFLQEHRNQNGTLLPSRVWCTICCSDFSIANSGESDIKKHVDSKGHKERVQRKLSNKDISSIFKPKPKPSNLTSAREAAWCYHKFTSKPG